MKKIITATLAGKILLGAFILMLIMHILILMRVVPSSLVWGGQVAKDQSNLFQLELFAIVVTLLFIGLIITKMRRLEAGTTNRWINIGIWIVFVYLVLNTVGNFASGVTAETLIFGPLTVIMAFSSLRLALEK